MHINTAPVYWQSRKSMGSIRLSMKFIQVTCNFVRQHSKLLVFTQVCSMAMQNFFPIKGCVTLRLII
jgi:hypothetical protein